MAPNSQSPSRRRSKKKQKQLEDNLEFRGNDEEMSHNRLDGFVASDFDYFREIQPKLREL
jgi:hypothetical protein